MLNIVTVYRQVLAIVDSVTTSPSGGGGSVTSVNAKTGVVVLTQDDIGDGATAKQYTVAERAANRDRANHTGSQLASTISNFAATVAAYITTVMGFANGLATLDGTGKIPIGQIPAGLVGAANYQGAWDAAANSPALATSVGTKGYYYVVGTPGATNLNGITDWKLGDWAIYNGAVWQKVDNTDAVISVNTRIGAVVITAADVGLGNADNTSDANKPVSTAQAAADAAVLASANTKSIINAIIFG